MQWSQVMHKVYKLSNGQKVHFRRIEPYMFWKIAWEKGAVPDILKGQYITLESAKRAARIHLGTRKVEILEEIVDAS